MAVWRQLGVGSVLVSYMPLGLNGALILCLDTRTAEQLREPADGSHARRFLVPIEVHSDSDRTLQPARPTPARICSTPRCVAQKLGQVQFQDL